MSFIFNYLWHSIFGWVGVNGLIIAGCLAVGWYLPPLRRTALEVAVILAVATFLYAKGYRDEYVHLTAQYKAAEVRARQAGEHARADAVRDAASGMRDPYDSDNN